LGKKFLNEKHGGGTRPYQKKGVGGGKNGEKLGGIKQNPTRQGGE